MLSYVASYKVCHIEAGLRSGDERMPEEINRLVTDRLSDLLLTPDELSIKNLKNEGILESKIEFVGNIMIDTLESNIVKASNLVISEIIKDNFIQEQKSNDLNNYNSPTFHFALMTMHRPSNVDKEEILKPIIDSFLVN